ASSWWQKKEAAILDKLFSFNIYTDPGFLNSWKYHYSSENILDKTSIVPDPKKVIYNDASYFREKDKVFTLTRKQKADFYRGSISITKPSLNNITHIGFEAKSTGGDGHLRIEIITDEGNTGTFRRNSADWNRVLPPAMDWSIYFKTSSPDWKHYLVKTTDLRVDEHMSIARTTNQLNPEKIMSIRFNCHDNKYSYVSSYFGKITGSVISGCEMKNIVFYK
ncbi:hypothetical protein OAR19_00700, partial [bacterium]|nr:hypothetical protein [bacterium]